MAWPSSFTTPPAGSGPAGHNAAHNELIAAVQWLKDNLGSGGGDTTAQVGTLNLPSSPTTGQTVSALVDSGTTLPSGVTWDSGGEPTVTGRLLIACVWSGEDWVCTYGLPIPAATEPPDETAPTPGTLSVTGQTTTTINVSVSGASDAVGLHATPYSFSSNGGSTWSAYQAGATYSFTGLTAGTSYALRHRVRDAAGNVANGTTVNHSTSASADTTDPTPGTLAASAITSSGFTLTVTGAADETALHATPYRFSTDNGVSYSTWQAGATFNATGLDPETEYTCIHQVRDAALNVATGSSIPVETETATVAVTDTFTRADSASTLGTTETGAKTWEYSNGTWGISSNKAYLVSTTSGNRSHANVEFGSADMAVEATLSSLSDAYYPNLVGRYVDPNNCYLLQGGVSSENRSICRRQGGTNNFLATDLTIPAGPVVLRLELSEEGGSTRVRCLANGSEIYNALDSTAGRPAGTKAGLFYFVVGGPATDNWDDFTVESP